MPEPSHIVLSEVLFHLDCIEQLYEMNRLSLMTDLAGVNSRQITLVGGIVHSNSSYDEAT